MIGLMVMLLLVVSITSFELGIEKGLAKEHEYNCMVFDPKIGDIDYDVELCTGIIDSLNWKCLNTTTYEIEYIINES